MFSIISLFSFIFSHAASIRDQYLKPLLSFNSRISATINSDQEQVISPHPTTQEQPSADDHVIIIPINSMDAQEINIPDHDQQEESMKMPKLEVVLTIALFMANTSAVLIINTAVPLHFFFLLIPYNTMLNFSMFIGVGLAVYIINKNITTSCSSLETAWFLRRLMGIGLITILLALVLRGCMVQPVTSVRFAWILFFLILFLIFLILWLWKRIRSRLTSIQKVPAP